MKEGSLKRISNVIKPTLSEENKIQRVHFALSMLEKDSKVFQACFNHVHVDEKWFYMTKVKTNYYLVPEETAPLRHCKSKRFIVKVMFLAAVARPRYDPHRKTMFDGKIGIWPIVVRKPAKRNSKNRPKGTLVTEPIEVTREIYKSLILEKVIPAIKQTWPKGSKGMNIIVQQDNARPHNIFDEKSIVEAGSNDGWNISLKYQPPNSPDFNALDLGFFNAIQALQHQHAPNDIDELITAVEKSFSELPVETLDNVFYSLQKAFECTMLRQGCNGYNLAHLGKQKLRREGRLPVTLECCQEAIDTALEFLIQNNC